MKKKSSRKSVKTRNVTHNSSPTPTKSMMLIVSLIGGGIAWMLSGNIALGLTVFASIAIGNWLVYHKGLSV